jgi:hypothetical protein
MLIYIFYDHLEYFTDILDFYMTIWYILYPFGTLFSVLVPCTKKIWHPWCTGQAPKREACRSVRLEAHFFGKLSGHIDQVKFRSNGVCSKKVDFRKFIHIWGQWNLYEKSRFSKVYTYLGQMEFVRKSCFGEGLI